MRPPLKTPERILVYRLGSLGDTLLALPSLHLIRRTYPQATISLLTHVPNNSRAPQIASLLEGTRLFDEVIPYPLGTRSPWELWKLRARLSVGQFDLGIHLAEARGWWKSARDAVFLRACGIPRIIGVPWNRQDLQCQEQNGTFEWEASRLARRIGELGEVDLEDSQNWELGLTASEQARANCLLHGANGSILAVALGSKVEAKDWGEENWTALLTELGRSWPGLNLVLLGASEDHARSERCSTGWTGNKWNLCGQAPIRVTAAILRRASLFLGHDSGPMHLAATVATPCVAIFSARSLPGQWFPRGKQSLILYQRLPCFGCGLDRCVDRRKECLTRISVSSVVEAVDGLMARGVLRDGPVVHSTRSNSTAGMRRELSLS